LPMLTRESNDYTPQVPDTNHYLYRVTHKQGALCHANHNRHAVEGKGNFRAGKTFSQPRRRNTRVQRNTELDIRFAYIGTQVVPICWMRSSRCRRRGGGDGCEHRALLVRDLDALDRPSSHSLYDVGRVDSDTESEIFRRGCPGSGVF
jgi:hypothetical protein